MKIGKFCDKNNISIDAVRHYMDLGLIIPIKNGSHYEFDERCERDLEEVLTFKAMGFTLGEIKSIFTFKRLGKLTNYQVNKYYKKFFIDKHQQIEKDLEKLIKMKESLEKKIEEINDSNNNITFKMGVPISSLPLLKCTKCQKDLSLLDGKVLNNRVVEGVLKCICGNKYKIEDGILMVKSQSYKTDYNNSFIFEYIKQTPFEHLDNLYKGLEWIYKKIDFNIFNDKVAIDLGVGIGFFLRNIYDNLPESNIYIAVDHDINKLKFLKSIIEGLSIQKNIIFICSDFLDMPIEEKSVDIVIDKAGSSVYGFEHEKFLLEKINHYIKEDAYLIGGYILFKNFRIDNKIPKKHRLNFIEDNVKKKIRELKFIPIDEDISDMIEESSKYESFFKKGEKIYYYIFYGKR